MIVALILTGVLTLALAIQRLVYMVRLRAPQDRKMPHEIGAKKLEFWLNWPFSLKEFIFTRFNKLLAPDTPAVNAVYWNKTRSNCHSFALCQDIPGVYQFGAKQLSEELQHPTEGSPGRMALLGVNPKSLYNGVYSWVLKSPSVKTLKYRLKSEGLQKATLWSAFFSSRHNRHLLVVLYSPATREMHSARLDPSGRWVHKPGSSEVRYEDLIGNKISSLRNAAFDDSYLIFGYYWKRS